MTWWLAQMTPVVRQLAGHEVSAVTVITVPCRRLVERLVLVRAEDLGEEVRQDAAEQQVCVRDGQIPALAVAHGSWVRARRVRTRLQGALGLINFL